MRVGKLVRKFNPDAKILVPGYEFNFAQSKPAVDPPDSVDNASPDATGATGATARSGSPPAGPPPQTQEEFGQFLKIMGRKLTEMENTSVLGEQE